MIDLAEVFERAHAERVKIGGTPTGAIVGFDTWKALHKAGLVERVPAQIRMSGTAALNALAPMPIDAVLEAYRGTLIHVQPSSGIEIVFSPQ